MWRAGSLVGTNEAMTTNNDDAGNDAPGRGKDQRPRLTLELTATEVAQEPVARMDTSHPEMEPPVYPAEPPYPPQSTVDASVEEAYAASSPPNDAGLQSFVTHMAAGLLGALFALVIAYYAAAGFRDRLPMLTDRSAEDFRARITKQEERLTALDKAVAAPRPETAQMQTHLKTLGEQTEDLKRDIAALTRRMDEHATAPAPVAAASPAMAPAAPAPVAAVAPSVTPEALAQNLEPLKAKLAELEGRLALLTKAQSEVQTDSKASAVAVALYNLRRAANEGKPFTAELKSVETMSPVPLELGALTARREQGVRNLAQLKETFETAANTAIETENRAPDEGFVGGLWSKTKSLVRIRRVGEVPGDSTEAILARAQVRLKAGDLRAAAKEAEQLKGPAAATFKPWLDEAQARLAVDETLTRVEASLLAALSRDDSAKRGG